MVEAGIETREEQKEGLVMRNARAERGLLSAEGRDSVDLMVGEREGEGKR